jgi:hypothetical protein
MQKDARLLREAIAYCCNYGTPNIQQRAMRALADYGYKVSKYCTHPDVSQPLNCCLDCGAQL